MHVVQENFEELGRNSRSDTIYIFLLKGEVER
jgi:hypothetical protein